MREGSFKLWEDDGATLLTSSALVVEIWASKVGPTSKMASKNAYNNLDLKTQSVGKWCFPAEFEGFVPNKRDIRREQGNAHPTVYVS